MKRFSLMALDLAFGFMGRLFLAVESAYFEAQLKGADRG
jgi:hypothetical protein